jgi:SM-20-related protein
LLPTYGTLVVFLSDEFPHEVLKAHRDRYSIAGWFRVNTTLGGTIDPPN